MLTYCWRHRLIPDLDRPRTFNERVQHRKLHDRDPRMARLADKLAVKAAVAEAIGAEWVTPTLWTGDALPAEPCWPTPFVVKSRHGCNQIAIVRDDPTTRDWAALRRRSRRWMRQAYGSWLDEWLYRGIPRGLIVEPFVGDDGVLPIDYKLFAFAGRIDFIQVHLDRATRHRWLVFDRDWRRVSAPTGDPDPPSPASLAQMIAGAEVLSRGFDFVRVDLYEARGRPRFGELTFYPGSGLHRFDPVALDRVMGDHWSAARTAMSAGQPG